MRQPEVREANLGEKKKKVVAETIELNKSYIKMQHKYRSLQANLNIQLK